MKRIASVLLLAVLFTPLWAQAQKRIYTRSYMLQDFRSKTTKVVLGGDAALNSALRQDIPSFWTITPYEFCTSAEYDKQKNNPDCYWLRPETVKGIVFLTLERGGKEDDASAFKRPFTVVSLPVCGERDNSGNATTYMPAFLSIIQDFTDVAIDSEVTAYRGLSSLAKHAPKGTKIYTDPAEAAAAFRNMEPDSAVSLFITPDGDPKSKPRHKLVFGTSGYELYAYGKH
ncbi:MAG: hypothetical protein J6W82_10860 [Bacteroidales bacterium]|nr:hypothetical protein [Bacteroidales bacterium]